MMLDTEKHIELNFETIDRGYQSCRGAVKKFFKGHLWFLSNLPSENRRALDAILFNLMRTIDLLELESASGLSLDVWHEIRDELSDAFSDKCSSVELAALVDAARKYAIPRQFLFDPLRGADLWIRKPEFDTWIEYEAFTSFVGGSSMASIIPALDPITSDWEVPAIQTGKAIMMTQCLARCIHDFKSNRVFFAKEDLEDCEVDLAKVQLRRETQPFRFLVRLYVSRIEAMFKEAAGIVNCVDFDGNRTLKAMISYHWKLLTKMKVNPESLYSDTGIFSLAEQLSLKSRHLMGIDFNVPIFPEAEHSHH